MVQGRVRVEAVVGFSFGIFDEKNTMIAHAGMKREDLDSLCDAYNAMLDLREGATEQAEKPVVRRGRKGASAT